MLDSNLQPKIVSVALNGVADSPFTSITFISLEDIKRRVQQVFDQKFDQIRLFTPEGVEMFREDLQFLKNETLLYVSDGTDFDQSSSFSVYEIVKFLGEGGFGKVLLGKHKITNELVAIKIIDTYKIGNAVDIDMVFREAELMKSLRHKGIVKIHNCYTLPNMQVVIVMEYLQGGELLAYLEEHGRISEDEARFYFKQIVEAMSYCHNQNLIHRDLKLENILLTSKFERKVKIVDFGIAGLASNFNVDKLDVGSLSYMAPEVLSGRAKKLGPSIDIWALGVILYALICGTLPFTKNNQQLTISAIIEGNYTFPHIPISNSLKDLLARMLNTDESRRIRMYEILNHPWVAQQVDMQKVLASPQYLLPGKKVFGRESTKVSFGGQKQSNLGRRELTSTKGLISLRSGTTQMKLNAFHKQQLNQDIPPISVKLMIPPSPRELDQSLLPSSQRDLFNTKSQRKFETQIEQPKQTIPMRKSEDMTNKIQSKILIIPNKKNEEIDDMMIQQNKKMPDLQIKINTIEKFETERKQQIGEGNENQKFITKNYEDILEKYKHLQQSFRIKVNPFQKEIEEYEKEKRRKNSPPQIKQLEESPSKQAKTALQQMIQQSFSLGVRPQTQAAKSGKFKLHKTSLSLTSSQFKVKNQHKCKFQSQINLFQSTFNSQECSLTSKFDQKFMDDKKTTNRFYMKPNWVDKFKVLNPNLKYQLQQNFIERKKNKEEVFIQTFRSFLKSFRKPIF